MPLDVWKNIRGDAVGELELEAQEKAVGGIVKLTGVEGRFGVGAPGRR